MSAGALGADGRVATIDLRLRDLYLMPISNVLQQRNLIQLQHARLHLL